MTLNLSAQNKVYKHYTTEQGLPHDITYQIIQDSQGYIWIGTDDGLVKFNGETFTIFGSEKGLTSNFVIDVLEDAKNKQFLIATWGRGMHVLKNDSIFKNEPLAKDYSKINKLYKLNDTLVYSASVSNRQVLYNLYTHRAFPRFLGYENEQLVLKETNNFKKQIRDVNCEFIKNKLYVFDSELNIATENQIKGLYTFDGKNYKKVSFKGTDNLCLHSITEQNDYFVLASYTTLFFYDGTKFLEKRKLKLPKGKIIQMQLHQGKLYFVFINKNNGLRELYTYDVRNNFIINVSKKLTIKSSISDFLFDEKGNLWITTYGSGVYQILNTNNSFYDASYFLNPDLRDIASLDDNIITIAPNIIYAIKNDTVVTSKRIPFHTETFQIQNSKEIDVIVPNKLDESYKDKFGGYDVVNKSHNQFYFKFSEKTVVITGFSFVIKENDKIVSKGEFHALKESFIHNAVQHENYIYAVFGRLGIFRLNVITGELINWTKSLGIDANMFIDIEKKGNTLWIAANNGVYKVFNDEVVQYTTKNGLLSNHVNDLFVDAHNILWVATQKGLNVLKDDNFYSIDKNLGQKSLSVEKITEYNNYLYVAGNRGLFKMDNLYPFQKKLNTHIKITQQNTNFSIAVINFINPNTIKIQYQLNDDLWIETSNGKLEFKNLTEDNYKLVFRYKDGLSDWSYTEPYRFEITKPWYQQLWFYILFILSISGVLVLLVYHQLVKARKKNKIFQKTLLEREKLQEDLKNVRHQIAQDFHDDLGNKLASISMLSNLSLKKTEKQSNLYPSLHQINKDANFLYAGMRDFVWSLDYKNNKLREVQIYLNDFGEKLFEYSDINFKSTNNVAKSKITLPHYWNKQLVLVFKEAMTNTLKHSKATEVLFSVYLIEEDVLEIKLEDNGVGFDLNSSGRKNGLQNMKERIESIKGELNIKSIKGFSVCFRGKI